MWAQKHPQTHPHPPHTSGCVPDLYVQLRHSSPWHIKGLGMVKILPVMQSVKIFGWPADIQHVEFIWWCCNQVVLNQIPGTSRISIFCPYFVNCLLSPIEPHMQNNLHFWGGQNLNPYFISWSQPFNKLETEWLGLPSPMCTQVFVWHCVGPMAQIYFADAQN